MSADVRASALAAAAPLVLARTRRHSRERRIVWVLGTLVVLVAAGSLMVGAYSLSVPDLLRTLVGQGSGSENFKIGRASCRERVF